MKHKQIIFFGIILLVLITMNAVYALPDRCILEPDLPECTITSTHCGDAVVQRPNAAGVIEQCDNGTALNGHTCTPSYGADCMYCSSTCTNAIIPMTASCGDGVRNGIEQCDKNAVPATTPCSAILPGNVGVATCAADCRWNTAACTLNTLDPWTTSDDGFWVRSNNMLKGTKNAISIYSKPFTLNIGTNYSLSADIVNPSAYPCTINFSFDDGQCMSGIDNATRSCFPDRYFFGTNGKMKESFMSSNSPTHVYQGQYRDVRLKIALDCTSTATLTNGIFIDNISLHEQAGVSYDMPSAIIKSSSCCGLSYCWNGSMCVESTSYTDNALQPPIWNAIFLKPWPYGHVNSTAQEQAAGYRCTLNNSGGADWIIANITYDWDFKESGYCSYPDQCFVGKDFDYDPSDKEKGCIPNGTFVAGKASQPLNTKGDHYCNSGHWTTRTHIMALELQKIALASGNPYRLFCDDTTATFIKQTPALNIDSSCVLVIRETAKERIIIGLITDGTDDTADVLKIPGDTIPANYIADEYYIKGVNPAVSCTPTGSSAYLACIEQQAPSETKAGLFVYYNNESKFYLLSNNKVDTLSTPGFFMTLWERISGFFARLFGGVPKGSYATNTTLAAIGNYDRIYFLSNGTIHVSALQEKKYDELDSRDHNFIYLNYSGTTVENNYLDPALFGNRNYTYASSGSTQEFILKDSADLWRYLTAVLRE